MVLSLKRWKSRSSPGIEAGVIGRTHSHCQIRNTRRASRRGAFCFIRDPPTRRTHIDGAGWSSPVARQAHNLKVVGSNPTPATISSHHNTPHNSRPNGGFLRFWGLLCGLSTICAAKNSAFSNMRSILISSIVRSTGSQPVMPCR